MHTVVLWTKMCTYLYVCLSLLLSTILMTFKLNMRQMLIFWMTVIIISVTLMADWQSIGHDPCREGFSVNNSMAVQPHRDEYISVEGGGQVCKSLSTSGNECFWNPNSRVTGEYCAECFKVCRSVGKSLNFIQFSVGLALFSMTLVPFQLGTIFLTSDVVPLKYQVLVLHNCIICYSSCHMLCPN